MIDIKEVISSLLDQAQDREAMVPPDEPDSIFAHDAAMLREAVRLLKAQEPRVVTLDEVTNTELVWYDWRTRGIRPAKVNKVPYKTGTYRIQRLGDIDEWVHADEYCEYWRCWTSRPTDEQREAAPWK